MTRKSFVFLALVPFATSALSKQALAKTDYCNTQRQIGLSRFICLVKPMVQTQDGQETVLR